MIDLSRVTFIDAAGLVLVAAAAENAFNEGLAVEFVKPASADAARYAARMHLGDCLEEFGVDARLPRVTEWDVGSRLIELHRFDPTGADELADTIHNAIIDHGGNPKDAKDFYLGVTEVLNNVVDHSGAAGGWAAMQVMPRPNSPEITFAVADVGIGLRRSLSANHVIRDDEHAIHLAFERGVSGTGKTRGEGLADLYRRVGRRDGIVRAWSGGATGKSRRNAAILCQPATATFPGTMIYASLKARAANEEVSE